MKEKNESNFLKMENRLKRVSLKLSTDMSAEEIREAIAKAMGVELEKIPSIDFTSAIAKIRSEKDAVDKIVSEYQHKLQNTSGTTPDKYEELHDLGKFIFFFDKGIQIITPDTIPKFPDFVIKREEMMIGVEHTRLINEDMKAAIKTAKYLIAKAQKLIGEECNKFSRTVNIFIDYNANVIAGKSFFTRKFSEEERDSVATVIATFIKSLLIGKEIQKPSFISQVAITPNQDSRTDLELAENYITQNNFSNLLLQRIKDKEKKANSYKEEGNMAELWLLIVVDDISNSSGFDLKTTKFPKIESSKFDRLILFEKFGGSTYMLYEDKLQGSV